MAWIMRKDLYDLPPTKIIVVYRNGDAYFPGRKVVVNPRYVPYFDNFLTSLTKGIEAPFGAVRRLYTATQGHQVHHLDDLQHGSEYVAAGNEAFKKLNVFTNGEVLVPPARIRIPKYTLRSWENVLAMVTEKVRLRTGAVFRLCTLNGHPVSGPTELENNHYYVAVGSEKFKALPYYQCVPRRDLLRENNMTEGYEIAGTICIVIKLTVKCCEPIRGLRCCGPEMNTKSRDEDENMPTQQV
uniref:Doublecortin domain-containing protein n=1 Tax=Astatotilapia calliptera TaxID=8154 RepID=A0AAX7UB56_ASTCA